MHKHIVTSGISMVYKCINTIKP